MSPGSDDARSRLPSITRALAAGYGSGQEYWLTDPLDVLIATVLSQHTTDATSIPAYHRLRRRFPAWEELEQAPLDDLVELIGPAGLGPTRARRLQAIIGRLREDYGEVTLEPLQGRIADEAMSYLLSLPGVGPKTAACVALFGLGLPVVPVDTHVARVAGRLALVPPDASVADQQQILSELAAGNALDFHIQLIEHGRKVCHPRRPKCSSCTLRIWCPGSIA